jgi:hypothetical protein
VLTFFHGKSQSPATSTNLDANINAPQNDITRKKHIKCSKSRERKRTPEKNARKEVKNSARTEEYHREVISTARPTAD